MKKSILFLSFMLSLHNTINAQQVNQYNTPRSKHPVSRHQLIKREVVRDYDHYIKKRDNQRAVGWTLLAGGVLLSGFGWLATSSESAGGFDAGSAILFVTGGIAVIGSIPCMIMASVYNRKAKLMLSKQSTGQYLPPGIGKTITGLSISIPLTK